MTLCQFKGFNSLLIVIRVIFVVICFWVFLRRALRMRKRNLLSSKRAFSCVLFLWNLDSHRVFIMSFKRSSRRRKKTCLNVTGFFLTFEQWIIIIKLILIKFLIFLSIVVGLGCLAGDTLKSAADHGLSVAAVGILWNKGYFKQNFWF